MSIPTIQQREAELRMGEERLRKEREELEKAKEEMRRLHVVDDKIKSLRLWQAIHDPESEYKLPGNPPGIMGERYRWTYSKK